VIGGWTDPQGSRSGIGALLLGVHDGARLVYAGKVGTGFTQASLASLHERLEPLARATSPFASPPREVPKKGVHWVEPKLVCEVEFTEWTGDGRLRHPSFQGLREDKDARRVVRETKEAATATATATATAAAPRARAAGPAAGANEVAGVELTHPDRVFYPAQAITKLELARWYETVAERMLPHVAGRPLALVRCPEGHEKECFFQKHSTPGMSPHVKKTAIRGSTNEKEALYVEDVQGLVALAQMGVLEIHVWGSRVADLERPDRIVFDLDPDPAAEWDQTLEGASLVRKLLKDVGLVGFAMVTGGKGLHVVAPIVPEKGWPEVKQFTEAVASTIAGAYPKRFTATMSKSARKGKVFIDWLRNGRGATAVAPWSTRARAGAPVAVPVAWDELEDVEPDQFTIRNLGERLARKKDPWKGFAELRQRLVLPG